MIISKGFSLKTGAIMLAAVIGAIFLNKYVPKDRFNFYPRSLINVQTYLFTELGRVGGVGAKIESFNSLARENDKLKQDAKSIRSLKAQIDDLQIENDSLRRAVRVSERVQRPIIYAGVFNINLAPGGYNVLLNKGTKDGVSEGDIVVTDEGALVGRVEKTKEDFSRVLFISDPQFKITAKVVNSSTAGIAKGALNEGLYLDFVVQEDQVKEGDVVISNGNDIFPPALVIGTIDHVESNPSQMFKKVRISPAIKDDQLGKVLVVKMK